MRRSAKSIARKKYSISTAEGPPCIECGGEMKFEMPVWKCPDHRLSDMSFLQGRDTMDRLRSQSAAAQVARADKAAEDIDPDLGILGDILADSLALNIPN